MDPEFQSRSGSADSRTAAVIGDPGVEEEDEACESLKVEGAWSRPGWKIVWAVGVVMFPASLVVIRLVFDLTGATVRDEIATLGLLCSFFGGIVMVVAASASSGATPSGKFLAICLGLIAMEVFTLASICVIVGQYLGGD